MKLTMKIKDIPESGSPLEVPFPPALLADALAGHDADLATSHLVAHLDLYRAGETISIKGQLRGEVEQPCSRCLEPAHLGVDARLNIVVGPASLGAEESTDEEIEYFTHDGVVLDLEPVLRESLILAIPMVVLCQPDCLGLCPVCGTNRNTSPCACQAVPPDPRLAVLRDVKL